MTVGAAALDAAEQARHAAELAERASATALEVQGRVASLATPWHAAQGREDESLSDFSDRADRLVARLRQLQRIPLAGLPASDVAGQPRYAG